MNAIAESLARDVEEMIERFRVGVIGRVAGRLAAPLTKASRKRGPYKTHCKYGHPRSGDNLYISPKGQRACRACVLRHVKAHFARHGRNGK